MGISRLPLHEFHLSCCGKDSYITSRVLGGTGDSDSVEDDCEVNGSSWKIEKKAEKPCRHILVPAGLL